MSASQADQDQAIIDQEARQERAEKAFCEWRERAAERMPELAARVFALRDKAYPGCGYHYGMEGTLGNLISRICNPENIDFHNPKNPVWSQHITLRIVLKSLIRKIWLAEHNGGKRYQREQERHAS